MPAVDPFPRWMEGVASVGRTGESHMPAAVDQVVAADLARFKDFMETRDEGTGPGRGEIAV